MGIFIFGKAITKVYQVFTISLCNICNISCFKDLVLNVFYSEAEKLMKYVQARFLKSD